MVPMTPAVDQAAIAELAARCTRNSRKARRGDKSTDDTIADLWTALASAARELATITL